MNAYENTFKHAQQTMFSFVIVDLTLAITMADMAAQSYQDFAKRTRNLRNARRAYDTVLRLGGKLSLDESERTKFDGKLGQLKCALEGLGERF